MRAHFSHRLAYSIASVAFVSAAMSSASPCYASVAQTNPTTSVQRTQAASTPLAPGKAGWASIHKYFFMPDSDATQKPMKTAYRNS